MLEVGHARDIEITAAKSLSEYFMDAFDTLMGPGPLM